MSSQAMAGAVIYAKNISLVSKFYAGTIGFDVAHTEADHVVLESPVFQLAILAIPPAIASSIDIANPPARRAETPIKLVFFVPDIAAAREAAAKLGGQLNPPGQEWRFRQSNVCDGHDPEGNVLQLRENAD